MLTPEDLMQIRQIFHEEIAMQVAAERPRIVKDAASEVIRTLNGFLRSDIARYSSAQSTVAGLIERMGAFAERLFNLDMRSIRAPRS